MYLLKRHFCILISASMKKNLLACRATDMAVASVTKSWLQFAKDRNGGRQRRAAARIKQAAVQQQ